MFVPMLISAGFFVGVELHLSGFIWECGFFFFAGTAIFVLHRAAPFFAQLAVAGSFCFAGWVLFRGHPSIATSLTTLAVVIIIAAAENRLRAASSRLEWIGDNTYGLYLWHVPVQIFLLVVVTDRSVFSEEWFLPVYFLGLMLLARVSFIWIERPARKYFRPTTARP